MCSLKEAHLGLTGWDFIKPLLVLKSKNRSVCGFTMIAGRVCPFSLWYLFCIFFLFILRPTGYEDIIDILVPSPRVDRLDLEERLSLFFDIVLPNLGALMGFNIGSGNKIVTCHWPIRDKITLLSTLYIPSMLYTGQ